LDRIKSKNIFIITILLILTLGINGCTKDPEGVVAEVNGEEITEEEYKKNLQIRKNLSKEEFGKDDLSKLDIKEEILNELILETLISQEAEKRNISISDEEIEKEIDKNTEEVGGEEKLREELEDSGISFDYYKEFIKKQYLFNKYKQTIFNEIDISNKKAEKYFEKNKEDLIITRASQIVVDDEKNGLDILDKLEDGEKFEDLAVEKSLDSSSAVKGGDLGYFSKEMIKNKELEDIIFKLQVGEISELVKIEDEYYIIYLQDRKDKFEDLKDEVIILLKEEEYTKHIKELQDNAKIKIFLKIDE